MSEIPEPVLEAAERELFRKGVDELNRGFYFEGHDTLEDLWHGVRGPSRDFFQGLIQVSVGCYHLTRGNHEGAQRLLHRALTRLAPYPDIYAGIALEPLRAQARTLRAAILDGTVGEPDIDALPKCRWVGAGG